MKLVGGGGVWPLARPPDRPSWEEALWDLSTRLWFRAAVPGLGCLRGPSWVRVDPREHPAVGDIPRGVSVHRPQSHGSAQPRCPAPYTPAWDGETRGACGHQARA